MKGIIVIGRVAMAYLLHYDRSFKLMDRFSSEKELSHLDILGLILDAHHNIWFVTDRSIGKLDPRTRVIKILNAQNDGFIRQDFDPIFFPCKDDEGDLYIPGGVIFGVGFDRIKPDALTETYPPSTIYLRNLRVNQKDFKLTTGLNEIPELNLDYSENRIALETGAIDYYSKGAGKIRYKLEGLKEDWKYAPSNYTIRYDLLPHGKYKLLMQAGNAADEFTGPVKSITLNIEPAIWNSLRFRLGAGILLLIIGWLLIRYRIQNKFRKTLENSEQERRIASMALRTAELQQQTTELEMKALRAQMNPHFIFNSLNSINRFILQNNKSLASEYLTKFSKLVRLILQNSQASLISLESELEALKLYLDLEALRFDYRFDHKISIPSELDISSLKIPPLIIQPYAENAIWHGLMHKEEKGKLDIEFSQEKNSLFIRIADDGVGREMARAFSSKSATRYKPMGLQITAERISKLQDGPGQSGDIRINDLVTPEGTPAGTEVIIQIPLIYD